MVHLLLEVLVHTLGVYSRHWRGFYPRVVAIAQYVRLREEKYMGPAYFCSNNPTCSNIVTRIFQ